MDEVADSEAPGEPDSRPVAESTAPSVLGGFVRTARRDAGFTQAKLAALVGRKSKQWLSSIETGAAVPSLRMLVTIHGVLHSEPDPESLALWILTWADARLAGSGASTVHELAVAAHEMGRTRLADAVPVPAGVWRGLADFPRAFLPLTVIVGDRRTPTADERGLGDYFALTPSPSDLAFLTELNLPSSVEVETDKIWLWRDHDSRVAHYGNRNLLIVGSPASNFAARELNRLATFPFELDRHWDDWWAEYLEFQSVLTDELVHEELVYYIGKRIEGEALNEKLFSGRLDPDESWRLLKLVKAMPLCRVARSGERSQLTSVDEIPDCFRPLAILDPADGRRRGTRNRLQNDFASVSIARNPYSGEGHVAIVVAGLHLVGTMQALRYLGRPEEFRRHPFGGVVEVTMNKFKDAPSRFRRATSHWETAPYSASQYLSRVRAADASIELPGAREEAGLAADYCDAMRLSDIHRQELAMFLGHLSDG